MPKKTTNRYKTTSCNTEKMFADALKRLLKNLPLEKISVQKLADECGVNRKTFYYHFENLEDLLRWTLETDAIEAFQDVERYNDPEELLRFCIKYIDRNRKMLKMAFCEDGIGFKQLRIRSGCHQIVRLMTERVEREQKLSVPEDYRKYVMEFYIGALVWNFYQNLCHRRTDDSEQETGALLALLKTGLAAALTAEPKEKVIPK